MTGSITKLVETLVAVGATPEQILAAVRTAEATKDDALEISREKARNRIKKWRDKQACNVTERSVTDTKRLTRGEDSSSKKHITEERKKEDASPAAQPKKGTRIPDDFSPDIEAAISEGLSRPDAERHARSFCDYWRARPGKEGLKLDWQATWRNWVRKAVADRAAKGKQSGSAKPGDTRITPSGVKQVFVSPFDGWVREYA